MTMQHNAKPAGATAGLATVGLVDDQSTADYSTGCQASQVTIIHCDGACEPTNPGGWGCWGWVGYDAGGAEVVSGLGSLGRWPGMTNNRAEYEALLQALDYAIRNNLRGVTFKTDSQLVVNQVTGRWACNAAALRPLRDLAAQRLAAVGGVLSWHDRGRNARADALSRQAYHAARQNGGRQ